MIFRYILLWPLAHRQIGKRRCTRHFLATFCSKSCTNRPLVYTSTRQKESTFGRSLNALALVMQLFVAKVAQMDL